MEYEFIAIYRPKEERVYGVVRRDLAEKFNSRHFETRPVTATRALEIIAEMATSTLRAEKSNS